MKKSVWVVLSAVVFIGLLVRWNDQRQQTQIQEGWLNLYFSHVQPKGGQVVFTPSRTGPPLQIGSSYFDTPTSLSTGSGFERGDEHFSIKYTVGQIDKDGVKIFFDADGGMPSPIHSSSGAIKLAWK